MSKRLVGQAALAMYAEATPAARMHALAFVKDYGFDEQVMTETGE